MSEHDWAMQSAWQERRSDLSRAVVTEKVKALEYSVGSLVEAQLHDGRLVQATVKRIEDTVAGKKVGIAFDACALQVSARQIVRVIT